MEQKRKLRKFSGQAKLKILEEGRQSGVSLTQVCQKYGISLSQYYQWEKKAREAMVEALNGERSGRKPKDRKPEMEAEIKRLKDVIVEVTASNIELKKTLSI
ncbi:MAG: transposase [Chlorobi bacterium]|nr:transposase [Chlorobiota bacterium]